MLALAPTYRSPFGPRAIPSPKSRFPPPHTRASLARPSASTFRRKTSSYGPSAKVSVRPTTYAVPSGATVASTPSSWESPPQSRAQRRRPSAAYRTTRTSSSNVGIQRPTATTPPSGAAPMPRKTAVSRPTKPGGMKVRSQVRSPSAVNFARNGRVPASKPWFPARYTAPSDETATSSATVPPGACHVRSQTIAPSAVNFSRKAADPKRDPKLCVTPATYTLPSGAIATASPLSSRSPPHVRCHTRLPSESNFTRNALKPLIVPVTYAAPSASTATARGDSSPIVLHSICHRRSPSALQRRRDTLPGAYGGSPRISSATVYTLPSGPIARPSALASGAPQVRWKTSVMLLGAAATGAAVRSPMTIAAIATRTGFTMKPPPRGRHTRPRYKWVFPNRPRSVAQGPVGGTFLYLRPPSAKR